MGISETQLLLRLGVAVVLGSAIGFERMLRDHSAGLRTHLIVALASATFMLVSTQFVFFQHYPNHAILRADVSRIASNVVVGIGFLGGGVILHSGMKVQGLTTAASLWLVAAIGLAAGGGLFILAGMVTLVALFALEVLRQLIESPWQRRVQIRVRMDLQGEFLSRAALLEFLKPLDLDVNSVDYSRDLTTNRSRIIADLMLASNALEEPLMRRLESLPGLRRVQVQRPDS